MARQYLQDGPYVDTMIASGSALVATTIEALWSGADFTPLFARDAKAGKIYRIEAGGLISTGASGTLLITPGIGTSAPGTTLGATVNAQTVPVSLTNVPWELDAKFIVRTIGAKGVNSTMIGTGSFRMPGTAATAGSGTVVTFGGTSALFDATIENFFTISKTLSVAGSITTQYAHIFSRN